MLAWVSGTIFGRDVVPDVSSNTATSPGPTGSRDGSPGASALSAKRPASRSVIASSTTVIPRDCATGRAGESSPAGVIRARGRTAARYLSSSSGALAGFNTTQAAFDATATIATASSG